MTKRRDRRLNLDWVTVTYRSLVLTGTILVGLAMAGWLTWSWWSARHSPRTLALAEIEVAEQLNREAATYGPDARLEELQVKAREDLAQARTLFAARHYPEARVKAITSRNASQQVIDSARSADTTRSEVRFYRLDGEVKVRRAGSLLWEDGNMNEPLRVGDTIRTATYGSAQIIYFDGSLTTVRPGSLMEISALVTDPTTRRVRVTESLKSGSLQAASLGAAAPGSVHEVATSSAVARASTAQKADFEVEYDERQRSTRVAVHEGEASMVAGDEALTLKSLERVSVSGTGRVSARERILPAPPAISPSDQKIFVGGTTGADTIRLVWGEVTGATGYRVQVSRHALMAHPARDEVRREDTSLALAELEPGPWFWRAAALDAVGRPGRFSPVSEFRLQPQGQNLTGDRQAPILDVTEFMQTGSLVIVSGRTEPDVNLWVGNQKVDIYEDGSFTAVVRLQREGRNQVEIIAQDPAGNETVARRDAFLELF